MAVDQILERLKPLQKSGEITAWIEMEGRPAECVDFPESLPPELTAGLAKQGIRQLYSHQASAYSLLNRGRHIVVVTPTASGKTLCYNLPVLETLIRNPHKRALYLFPTKALGQDQMSELRDFAAASGQPIRAHTYDGDTPADMRRKIRSQAQIILTNPDMLHGGILPHHPKWVEFFQNLRYVVVDELHTYRGVLGSHVANVFRRLKRVARFYDSQFQFICASATIANPADLAEGLLGEEVATVDHNGAPRAPKVFIFYNPPLIDAQLGLRRSALSSARRFAEAFLENQVQTLVFASSRVNVEVLLRYLQSAIDRQPGKPAKVRGYRGGYLPRTRREIERQLRNREILGVVSTNALELGIDIGSLEACVLAGYPGSVASTWQQVGRAGRRSGQSAAILVARNLPLDQFIVGRPEYFLGRSPEHGLIHPDNLQILVSHIKCAAFELPFRKGERFGNESLAEILEFLVENGTLACVKDAWHWTDESYPAGSVNLRSIADENFVVLNLEDANRAIAEVDFDSAPELIHQEAIYMCEGRQYQVERLDYGGRKAYVRPVEVDYYTQAITYSGLRVLAVDEERPSPPALIEQGEVHLVKKFPGFKKIKFYSNENLGYGKIHLPVHELHTSAYWFTIPEAVSETGLTRLEVTRGFLGLSYALHHIATLLLMCDVRDLGRSVGDRSTRWFALAGPEGIGFFSTGEAPGTVQLERFDTFDPTVFLYDNYAGGVGFSEKLYRCHEALLDQARQLIGGCPCQWGCPSCVGPVNELGKSTKAASIEILERLRAQPAATPRGGPTRP
ncbi:MAG: DEAD/DEAH box helicase [Acidobacteriota bacterium]